MSDEGKPTLFRPNVGSRGMTELHYAAYCGDMNGLARALAAGSHPDTRDTYRGYAAVHWLTDMAASGGPRVQMLRALVTAGADVLQRAGNGASALELALASGSSLGEDMAAELKKLGVE